MGPVPGGTTLNLLTSRQSGKLQLFELASGALLETVDAHEGALWSLCLAPDQVWLVRSGLSRWCRACLFR